MCPSFFALFSKAGIACAADTDHTVYRLSKDLPVAIAVNPASPIPWGRIIEDYKRNLVPKPQHLFADYVFEFGAYLSTIKADKSWKNLSPDDSNFLILGFGSEDIFPSVYDVFLIVNQDGSLELSQSCVHSITLDEPAFFHVLGNFDSVSTLLVGSTENVRDFFYDKFLTIWKTYAARVRNEFKETEYEHYVEKKLEEYDYASDIEARITDATNCAINQLLTGVSSFSVEDMVTAVESLVNANIKLNHLRSCAQGKPGDAKEIAVITIPEGVSWIKHSLYKRRSEL